MKIRRTSGEKQGQRMIPEMGFYSAYTPAAERAALAVAFKASIVPNEVDGSDFAELKKFFDDGEIVEIIASTALFGYLNRWNDTMSTDLEEYPAAVAEKLIRGVGWNAGKHLG